MKLAAKAEIVRTIEMALDLPAGTVSLSSEAKDIEGWDSLGHLNILTQLDIFLDGKVMEINEIASATSVPKIIGLLERSGLVE